MRNKVVSLILNKPKQVLFGFLFLSFLILPGIVFLKSDFSYRAWYSEDDPLLINFDKFEEIFGNDDSIVIGIKGPNDLYNKESIELIYDMTERFWEIPNIVRVDSLANYDHIKATEEAIDVSALIGEEDRENITLEFIDYIKNVVTNNKLVENFYISKDGKMAVLRGKVIPSLKKRLDNKETIEACEKLVREFKKKYPKHEFHIAGTATFIHIFREITERDLAVLIPLLYTLFGIILYVIFRKKAGVLYPFMIIFASIGLMLGISGYLGHYITTISSAAPSILLTIAVADTVHILTVYFFARRQGFDNKEAVKYSLTKNFLPTFLTSLTTSIGFFSFSNSLILSIADLGVEVGFGVLLAWCATYFLLGPILMLFPIEVETIVSHKEILTSEEKEKKFHISQRTKQFVPKLFQYKFAILFSSLVLSIVSFYFALGLEINLDPNKQFKETHPYKVAFNKMLDHFGPMAQVQIMIKAGANEAAKQPEFLNKVDEFDKWINEREYFTKTISILDTIKNINQALNQDNPAFHFIPNSAEAIGQNLFFYSLGLPQGRDLNNLMSLNADYIRLSANWNIQKSKEATEEMKVIEDKAKELGLNALVTGKMPLFHQLTPYVVSSFIQSFSIALISITIILIIVLKSFKLGFLALIPNLFPLIIGSGIYALTGEYLDIASVLIVAVCLGIAVDDSIHFLFEFKKFRERNYSLKDTFEIIYTNTAPSLINTTVLIAIGFGSFFIADYIPNAKFGVMVSIILLVALIADLLILPAVLILSEKDKK